MLWLLRRLTFLVFLFLLGIGLYFWFQKESILEEYLSDQLGQKVNIEKLTLRPDHIVIDHLTLDNPNRSHFKKALTIERIQCNFPFFWILQKRKTISSLTLTQPRFHLELYNHSGIKNNWAMIFQERLPTTNATFQVERLIVKRASFNIVRQKNRPPAHYTIPDFSLPLSAKDDLHNLGDIFQSISYTILLPLTEHLPYQEILHGFPNHRAPNVPTFCDNESPSSNSPIQKWINIKKQCKEWLLQISSPQKD